MECQQYREAVSARIDGELDAAGSELVDAHLTTCPDCADWQLAAERLTRQIRVRPAIGTPDLTAAIMAASRPEAPAARPAVQALAASPRRGTAVRRILLAAVAVAQLTMGLVEFLSSDDMGHMMSGDGMSGEGAHLFNESTAWNLALGIGFLVAAVRPRLAAGLLPTLGAFVVVLTGFSMADILAGRTDLARVATHLLVVAGMVLLWLVHRSQRRGPRRVGVLPDEDDAYGFSGELMPDLDAAQPRPGRRGLRPAGRHVA